MSCTHCEAGDRRGRFCVGCGRRLLPPLQPMRPARRSVLADLDHTQPVLRLDRAPRPRVPQRSEVAAEAR